MVCTDHCHHMLKWPRQSRSVPAASDVAVCALRRLAVSWEGVPMTFDDVLAQILDILRQQGRVSYAALKRRFALDDAYLDDLKTELIDAQRLALDEAGRVLVWRGGPDAPPERSRTPQAVPDAQPIRHDRP